MKKDILFLEKCIYYIIVDIVLSNLGDMDYINLNSKDKQIESILSNLKFPGVIHEEDIVEIKFNFYYRKNRKKSVLIVHINVDSEQKDQFVISSTSSFGHASLGNVSSRYFFDKGNNILIRRENSVF